MDNYSEIQFEVKKKTLLIFVSVLAFLIFAYIAGEVKWFTDILLFIELFASVLAIFIGILALVRFYTRKNRLNYLMLGIGYIFVGVLEIVQILSTINGFGDLFVYSNATIFPLNLVLSKVFLSVLIFLSWFVRKEDDRPNVKKERIVFLSILFLFIVVIALFVMFSNVLEGYREYVPALAGGILSMVLCTLSIIGYSRSKVWHYESFDYWLIFSLVFLLISSVFFLPLLNLEYALLMKLSALARITSYIIMLVGFLVSIYEMYMREISYLEALKTQNEKIVKSKNSVEEAYLQLREEKLKLRAELEDEN